MTKTIQLLSIITILFFSGCSEKEETLPVGPCQTENFISEFQNRNFKMGFTSWPYAATEEAVSNTYNFMASNGDIYTEHIDNKIPWNAWINNTSLPNEFTNEMDSKLAHKIPNIQLLLSVSLLNTDRSDLAEDIDGSIPNYSSLSDQHIEDAYVKHIEYLVEAFQPNYLVIALEVNELKINAPQKWEEYKELILAVKTRIKQTYPLLLLSESITLHNYYQPEVANPEQYIEEISEYAKQMDFVAISYYPFFKGQHSRAEFQQAFDFLHSKITNPIAFVETGHLAENLSVESYDLFIESNECEQNAYVETLLLNAQKQNYKFVIWWTHRDFDALWETFPEEVKDLGKLWRDTGLLDENGVERVGYRTWEAVLSK